MTRTVKSAPQQTAAPNLLDLLPVVIGLREALARHGEITIRIADLPGMYGATFADNAIWIAHDLPSEQWRPTLVHELLHVLRGSFTDVDVEESHIRGIVEDVEALLLAAGASERPVAARRALRARPRGPGR